MNPELTHIDEYLGGSNAENSEPSELHLWVNSDQISFHEVELPDAPKSKWMTLLPWILEDEFLIPIEEMHLVICHVDSSRRASVAAIPKKEMYRLQLLLENQPSQVRSVLPDVLALPLEEGFISLAAIGDRLLVRSGRYQGFSGSAEFVWQVLELQQSQGVPLQIQCFGIVEESVPSWASDISSFNANPINWQFSEPLFESNLLAGDFRSRSNRFNFRAWMPSMALGALAACLLLSLGVIDHVKTGRELLLIDQHLLREFEASFGVSASSPARVQVEGAQIIRDRELRYLSVVDSILPITQSIDAVLSGCSNCELVSAQINTSSATLVMNQNSEAISRLRNLEGYSLTSGEPNEQQQVVLNIQRAL